MYNQDTPATVVVPVAVPGVKFHAILVVALVVGFPVVPIQPIHPTAVAVDVPEKFKKISKHTGNKKRQH